MATSEYEHSSIPATVKNIFNLRSFLSNRDAWAGSFHNIVQILKEPRTDCPVVYVALFAISMQLPTPVRTRETEANEDAKLTEFQQELVQLTTMLKGEGILTNFSDEIRKWTVKQGYEYMKDVVKSFFKAGNVAKKMGVNEQQIVKPTGQNV
ncbi:hypothetical protein Vadar_023899 [Vaccinium darrowii]|uniref:Uncharacterized protein n=1 Tax=Vaccinium darrowii TaxID=229202 RepID=A0ACB7XC26_9ERIC|nr:hypothetical protein Vadar_023899 [Vaccinium darrowii]